MDEMSRDRIRTDLDTNFFVEAGAGSGKTHELVERMVSMVEKGIDISKICAITFTKNAANEFYSRFQDRLMKSGSANAKKALEDIDLCFMGTIDSFCNKVLLEHPTEANVPSNFKICDNIEKVYFKKLEEILNGKKGSELKDKAILFTKTFYNYKDVYIKGMKIVGDIRHLKINYPICKPKDFDKKYEEEIAEIRRLCEIFWDKKEYVHFNKVDDYKFYDTYLRNRKYICGSWGNNLKTIQKVLENIKKIRISSKLDLTKIGIGVPELYEKPLSAQVKCYIPAENSIIQQMINEVEKNLAFIALDFIESAFKVINEELRKEGNLTYLDQLIYFRDLLDDDAKKGGKLIKYIAKNHKYFLIDEFQDTNPVQIEIFFRLASVKQEDKWYECVPREGSLFVVGDPKQSIYRFRNADINSYLYVKNLFKSPVGEVLSLSRNFRSSKQMCKYFNGVFSSLLNDQIEFENIPLEDNYEDKGEIAGVYKYELQTTGKNKDDMNERIATIINGIVGKEDITISVVKEGHGDNKIYEKRPIEYKDIMLISYNKTKLSNYMKVLDEYNIPYMVEGRTEFDACPSLMAIYYLASGVINPYDKKAMFFATHLSNIMIDEEKIKEYAKVAREYTMSSLCEMLLEKEEILKKVSSNNIEYLYYAFEILREKEINKEILSLEDGIKALEALINEDKEERCIELTENQNKVHIANLHKIKGLEAPVVILCDRTTKEPSPKTYVNYEEKEAYILNIASENNGSHLKLSEIYKKENEKEKEENEKEKGRLLYVAATRAKNALIIPEAPFGSGNKRLQNVWDRLLTENKLDIISHFALSSEIPSKIAEVVDASSLVTTGKENSSLNGKVALEHPSYSMEKPSLIKVKSKVEKNNEKEEIEEEEEKQEKKALNYNPALMGTIVHKLMEMIVSSRNKINLDSAINEISNEFEAYGKVYKDALKHVGETIRNGGFTQENGVPKDILNELLSSDEVHCEYQFSYMEDNKLWNGIMDVVYKKDNKWHIVDYKTNHEADDLDTHYQEQLSAYKKALKSITGNDSDALIYHIDIERSK